jgi:hypothetical protein
MRIKLHELHNPFQVCKKYLLMPDAPGIPARKCISGFFSALIGVAIVLCLAIVVLPGTVFLAISNYLQIIAALSGALVLIGLWRRSSDQQVYLWAGAGLGLWGIANIGWYAMILLGMRDVVFPSIIDAGIIASIFTLVFALRKGFVRKPVARHITPGILAVSIVIPVAVIGIAGLSPATLVTLIYFAACGILLITGLNSVPKESPMILCGVVIFALTFMIYPLRELFLSTNTILPVIGTFVVMGFSLIVLGLLQVRCRKSTA